jgi:hypothetical protein
MNPTPTPPVASHVVDGVIGTFHVETQSKQSSDSNPKSTTPNVQNPPPSTPSLGKTSEVTVQSKPTYKNQNKKKGKRIKRTKTIINNMINTRLNLFMTKTNANMSTFSTPRKNSINLPSLILIHILATYLSLRKHLLIMRMTMWVF